jgi:hypothetical protein
MHDQCVRWRRAARPTQWLPSQTIVANDLSSLGFAAYSADGLTRYPPSGFIAGLVDGYVQIPGVPFGP